jgi:cyclopropane-fatty-acyl-phospholipid synthase
MTIDQRIAALVLPRLLASLDRCEGASVTFELPDGAVRATSRPSTEPPIRVRVRDWAFFRRFALSGDMGAGESYSDGEWESDVLVRLVRLALLNRRHFVLDTWLSRLVNLGHDAAHRLRPNTRAGSRRNIAEHYDLSNEFFALFLDETLTYSSAVFDAENQPLTEAQRNKYDTIARKAGLRPGLSVLEIGCGFGGFAMHAARRYGCRVTGLTLSRRQHELATERVARAGLGHRVDLRLEDYRDLPAAARFDRVVSIEMFEALGRENWPGYFRSVENALSPDGWAVLQTIAIPDHRFAEYERHCDWLQRYIFPGSLLASLGPLTQALVEAGALGVQSLEDIGPHYALTLRLWRRSFRAARERVLALGFDERFVRTWDYYLAICEAAFATRTLQNLQIVLARPNTLTLPFLSGRADSAAA